MFDGNEKQPTKPTETKERKNNESTNSVQKNTNSATAHRTAARRRRGVGRATPACGLSTVILAMEHYPSGSLDLMCNESQQYGWFLKTIVHGDSDVYVVQNTFPVGAHTGWHTHPGPSLVTVTAGTITAYEASDPTCTP